MTQDIQALVRIVLRYGAMAMIAGGYVSSETGAQIMDPELLAAAAGALVAIGTETWYLIAAMRARSVN